MISIVVNNQFRKQIIVSKNDSIEIEQHLIIKKIKAIQPLKSIHKNIVVSVKHASAHNHFMNVNARILNAIEIVATID